MSYFSNLDIEKKNEEHEREQMCLEEMWKANIGGVTRTLKIKKQ